MFHFPWKVHGIAKGPPKNLLVQVEHTHLVEVYERALANLEFQAESVPKPKHSGTERFQAYQGLLHDIHHYKEMLAWLRELDA